MLRWLEDKKTDPDDGPEPSMKFEEEERYPPDAVFNAHCCVSNGLVGNLPRRIVRWHVFTSPKKPTLALNPKMGSVMSEMNVMQLYILRGSRFSDKKIGLGIFQYAPWCGLKCGRVKRTGR